MSLPQRSISAGLLALLTLATVTALDAQVDPGHGGEGYYLVVRCYPPGATVYRPMGSDRGNQGAVGTVNYPVLVKASDPPVEEWQFGESSLVKEASGDIHPDSFWGYAPLLRTIQLQPPKGALHPMRFDEHDLQVRYVPDLGYPEFIMDPAPGFKNFCLRQIFAIKYHWVLSIVGILAGVAATMAMISHWPSVVAARAHRKREAHWNEKFQNFDPDSDRFLNRAFTKWRTVQRLGQGGMATVYLAIPMDTLNEAEAVAIKVMNPDLMRDLDYRKRFEREIEISRSLDHPNVIRPVDWGEQKGVLFLVMEYVKGKPLRDIMPKKGFPVAKALQLAIDISSALIYAHNKGIVHRDLKPENIMITDKGLVKVMDLGLAKRRESDNVTRTGDTFGTPAYMAPEQIAGGGALLPATDQYATGVILFELLLGVRPFVADDTLTLVLKHLNDPPPRVRTVAPQLPQDLDDVIDRMLAKDPSRRFPNMVEIKARLEAIRLKYE